MTTENISGPNKSTAKPKVSKRATGKTVSKGNTKVANKPPAKADAKAPAKMGRPSTYNERLAEEFCRRIALGRSLRSVCEDLDMPGSTTVIDWKLENADFAARYARAMEDRGLSYGDRISDLIDQVLNGQYEVDRARLALDGLKWTAARLAPKQYGDKQSVEVTADIGATAASVLMELTARAKQAKQIEHHQTIDITPLRFADTLPSQEEQ